MFYTFATIEINFQKNCCHVHVLKIAHNLFILTQIIDRVRRFENQIKWIYLYEYIIFEIFDDRAIMKNIEKTMFQIMIELNRQIFYDQNDDASFVDIERWILHESNLFFYDEIVKKWELNQRVFSIKKLLKIILENAKEKRITIWNFWQTIFFDY